MEFSNNPSYGPKEEIHDGKSTE